MLKNNFIAWYYALWMVKVLENVFRGIICSFAVNNWSNLWRYWNQMFALFPPPYLCSSEEHKYGVPIVSPINFCYTFWRSTQPRKTAQTWDLARLLIYRYSIISEILSFRHSTVLILLFDGVTVKTTNMATFFSNCILLLRCLSRITVPSSSKNNVPKDYLSRQVSWNREKYTKNTGFY